jgi:hypothetical protein
MAGCFLIRLLTLVTNRTAETENVANNQMHAMQT